MDPQKWAKVCEWVSVHHPPDRRLPYDLAERRAKADRYAGTISKILTGLSPEALGITSLGVRKK